ncbi:hypothetical protein HK096_009220 [Nowakowskiella sp. JEL0078]|nr:hypothetical protein HK096_009220 [Nowakowskiella sp. JEL0078]
MPSSFKNLEYEAKPLLSKNILNQAASVVDKTAFETRIAVEGVPVEYTSSDIIPPEIHVSEESTLIYDLFAYLFTVVLNVFFREIRFRGLQNVPKDGPVLVVAAPHANQFIDPLILWARLPRRVSFIAAKKTMDKRGVGFFARSMNSIPVQRPQDMIQKCDGLIRLLNPSNAPLIINGRGTSFLKDFCPKDSIVLPGGAGSSEVAEVITDTELRLTHPFTSPSALSLLTRQVAVTNSGSFEEPDALKGTWAGALQRSYSTLFSTSAPNYGSTESRSTSVVGTSFQKVPFIDQSELMHTVMDRLCEGGVIGVFPEGGSHDRPEFLPLKAGAALMSLGAMAMNPEKPIKIVPVGLSYFNPHRFRSRAVIECGEPIEIDSLQVRMYQQGGDAKKLVVADMLERIKTALKAITVTAPDYDTLTVASNFFLLIF